MARTKKASSAIKKNRNSTMQNESSSNGQSIVVEESTATINAESDNKNQCFQLASGIPAKTDNLSVGEPLSRSMRSNVGNGNFVGSSSEKVNKKPSTGSAKEEKFNDERAITDDLEISGVSALMTDDSRASSVIDLTESINETRENSTVKSEDKQQEESAEARKSIRKPLKRLSCSTTPFFNAAKERTSKGTPYIRKVSSLLPKPKFSTGKKERIAEEIKKTGNVKRVTFNNGATIKKAAIKSKPQMESTNKQQSAIKMPNFSGIHQKLFDKMESIDVTVRKREERMKAASSKKENEGPTQKKDTVTSTTTKKVVRKLDNTFQPGPSNLSQPSNAELSKSVQPKSFRFAPKAEVLQERSNRDAVFKFTGNSDSNGVSQSLPAKKSVENRTARRQQAYKSRPMPSANSNNSDRLRGVRLNRRFQLQMKFREEQNEV